jgi:hypothetical protein
VDIHGTETPFLVRLVYVVKSFVNTLFLEKLNICFKKLQFGLVCFDSVRFPVLSKLNNKTRSRKLQYCVLYNLSYKIILLNYTNILTVVKCQMFPVKRITIKIDSSFLSHFVIIFCETPLFVILPKKWLKMPLNSEKMKSINNCQMTQLIYEQTNQNPFATQRPLQICVLHQYGKTGHWGYQ